MLTPLHLASWPVQPYKYVNNGRNSFAEGSPGQVILRRAAENPQGRGGFLETLLPDVGIEEVQLGTYEVKRWMIVA